MGTLIPGPRRALRRTRRRALTAGLCALVCLAATAALAPAAPAAGPPSSVRLALIGSHMFSGFEHSDITAFTTVSSLIVPGSSRVCSFGPIDPCRALSTAIIATALNGTNSCGAQTVGVPVSDSTSADTVATVRALPPNPVLHSDPCNQLGTFVVHYAPPFAGGGTRAASATVGSGSVDLPLTPGGTGVRASRRQDTPTATEPPPPAPQRPSATPIVTSRQEGT